MSSENSNKVNILPHEATTNDPDGPKKDLSDFLPKDSGNKSDLLGRPPHIPNEDHVHNLEKPLDKSDLQSRVNELNK